MGTALSTLLAAPITCTLSAFMSGLFFVMWNQRIGLEAVCLTYVRVVRERQYYRLLSATLTHVDLMHVLFNMGGLLNLAPLEGLLGSLWYLETTLLLMYASWGLWLLAVHAAATRYGQAAWAEAPVVGYSGVLFGWMTLAGVLLPSASVFGLPSYLAPWASLLLTQLIVPRASFLGHLAGILAGYAVASGALSSARGYWLWAATAGMAGAALLSLRSTPLGPRLERYLALSPALLALGTGGEGEGGSSSSSSSSGRARIVGGVLTQWREVGREELAASQHTLIYAPVAGVQAGAAATAAAAATPTPTPTPTAAAEASSSPVAIPVVGATQQQEGEGSTTASASNESNAANDPSATLLSRHV